MKNAIFVRRYSIMVKYNGIFMHIQKKCRHIILQIFSGDHKKKHQPLYAIFPQEGLLFEQVIEYPEAVFRNEWCLARRTFILFFLWRNGKKTDVFVFDIIFFAKKSDDGLSSGFVIMWCCCLAKETIRFRSGDVIVYLY